MNKNILMLLVSGVVLLGAIGFDYKAKKDYNQNVNLALNQAKEVENIAQLQNLWSAKGVVKKLNNFLNTIPSNKKRVAINRKKATISFIDMNERELNRALSKLASLPIKFNSLNITRSGNKFSLECLCVW